METKEKVETVQFAVEKSVALNRWAQWQSGFRLKKDAVETAESLAKRSGDETRVIKITTVTTREVMG